MIVTLIVENTFNIAVESVIHSTASFTTLSIVPPRGEFTHSVNHTLQSYSMDLVTADCSILLP